MNWDVRDAFAKIIGDFSEGQQGEGGFNKDNNCVPTSETIIAQAYGGPDLNPQQITNATYGTSFHGGEDYGPTYQTLRNLWPMCPSVSMPSYGDVLAQCDVAGEQREAIMCSFHCDAAGRILTYATGILHVCPVIAHVDGVWYVLNVEDVGVKQYSDVEFRAATTSPAGQLLIFNASLPGGSMDAAKEESLDQECAWKTHESVLGRIPNGDEFAWALGEARKSHIAFLWEVINGSEFKAGGGLLGVIARQGAQIAALTAEVELLKAGSGATVNQAGEDAQNAHIAAVQAAMAQIAAAATGATK